MSAIYDYTCGINGNPFNSSANYIYGIRNETGSDKANVTTATFYFINDGTTPSGNAYMKMFDASNSVVATSAAVDMSVVSASSGTGQGVDFSFSGSGEAWLDDYTLAIEFQGTNLKALGNYATSGTCPENLGFQSRYYNGSSWGNTSEERLMNAVVAGPSPSGSTLLPPPPIVVNF